MNIVPLTTLIIKFGSKTDPSSGSPLHTEAVPPWLPWSPPCPGLQPSLQAMHYSHTELLAWSEVQGSLWSRLACTLLYTWRFFHTRSTWLTPTYPKRFGSNTTSFRKPSLIFLGNTSFSALPIAITLLYEALQLLQLLFKCLSPHQPQSPCSTECVLPSTVYLLCSA